METNVLTPYEYTQDYVSHWLPIWEQCFARFSGKPSLNVLEIGSFEGRSTVWFLNELMTDADASIFCIDPFYADGTEALFDKNIAATGAAHKVTKLVCRSDEYLAMRLDVDFDLVYVDGGHDAVTVLFDSMLAWPTVKPGGMLMFDDYEWEPKRPPHDRPQVAIDVCLENWKGQFDVVHRGYQVIIRKRP